MNTKGKIVVVLAVMMVAAAMVVPAVMGETEVAYSATVSSQQNTVLISSNGDFGNVSAGSINVINPTIQLNNTGNTAAKVTAMGANFTADTNSFDITNLKINSVSVTTAGAVVVASVPADDTTYGYLGELSIPTGQVGGSYTTTVTLLFENAGPP